MAVLGPTSRPSDDIANGRVARELPVAPALLIRQELAQKLPQPPFSCPSGSAPSTCALLIRRTHGKYSPQTMAAVV